MSKSIQNPAGTLWGHPKGLFLLFGTELWERFSYYGMRALLVLYLTAQTTAGGLGWSEADALKLYGIYTGLVYITPLIGGWLADSFLGQRRAIIFGAIMMAAGQFTLALPHAMFPGLVDQVFYVGLALLIAGNGMFKPNISTMVGDLYEQGDHRRDGAFTIFYMGINLGALLAGFVAGYVVEFLKKITEKLPASLNGIRPMLIYPLGGVFVMGVFMCGINPVMGIINDFITNWLNSLGGTSAILLGAVSAVMMSIDMGGPFNKAGYLFGTAALASGNYEVMASVMVGGMVPPIAIALSTTFFPKKWTPDERRNGVINYVMGLCFVTEGAIPYAASDPLHVIPSCAIGAATADALSMAFHCGLRAPHGGIFVFPVATNAPMYCVALAVGSILGGLILSLLKKNLPQEQSSES